MAKQWFDVDRGGLGKQAEQYGKGRLVGELIQNALDEEGVTRIEVVLEAVPGQPMANLVVNDDCPEGFHDLSHAYTMFAESRKRGNPEQRGQFNFGEKLVLAACQYASISTTKGTVLFDPKEGRIERPRHKTERGSIFEGRLRMTRDELAQAFAYLQSLLLPSDVDVTLNGGTLPTRKPLVIFEASLDTPVADNEGVMRMRSRKTPIGIYEPLAGEVPHLYEMGLPIVETGDKWHVDIGQKVPLNRDRDNVTPAYLRAVRTLVLNEMCERLTEPDANAVWVRQASGDRNCSNEAITKVLDLRFGARRASYDMNDIEANKTWVSMGGTLVYGSMLSKDEWDNAKIADAIVPAGQLCPTPKPYSDDPDAPCADIVPEEQWTDGMKNIVSYAKFLGRELMKATIDVKIVDTKNKFRACFGGRELHFNLRHLGAAWFDKGSDADVDQLLIHEYGHHYSGDHLSSEYHKALCYLGAKLKELALVKPDELKRFMGMSF